jgi:hypothetical protein
MQTATSRNILSLLFYAGISLKEFIEEKIGISL